MHKKLSLIFIFLLAALTSFAQHDTATVPTDSSHHHLRVSLLTCGVGEAIWETYGHTGVRIIDSSQGIDIVYNYGTFDGFAENFEIKFMRGKADYYISVQTYDEFMQEYIAAKRKVEEQELLINEQQKEQIFRFLDSNAEPAYRNYKYDFFYDNCATRIRDIFPHVLEGNFIYGNTIAADHKITFRNINDIYLRKKHWERLGINILLGSKIDKVMTNKEIMFLPDYLRDGVGGATLDGKKIASPTTIVLPGGEDVPPGVNQPFIVMCLFALLTILGLYIKQLRVLGNIMTFLSLFISGLLGCLIVFMWLGTDHQACSDNYNILWALPTNLFFAFLPKKNKSKYSVIGIVLILATLVLHLFKVQEFPLFQLSPFLLSLLLVFGTIYRKSRVENRDK